MSKWGLAVATLCATLAACAMSDPPASEDRAAVDELDPLTITLTLVGGGNGTVSSDVGSISCGTACSDNFANGTVVTLSALPDTDSAFAGWSGACTGTDACQVTMDGPQSVAAEFVADNDLAITFAGNGSGVVNPAPGAPCSSDCDELFAPGTVVTLSATASTDSTFMGWSGGCTGTGACTVTLDTMAAVTATFALEQRTLQVVHAGAGGGKVTSSPAGINCGATCTASYDAHTAVTLTATANATSTFTGWSGGGCTGTKPCTVTLDAATKVTATFAIKQVTLTVVVAGPGGAGSVTANVGGINCPGKCKATFAAGTKVTLTTSVVEGARFVGWTNCSTPSPGICKDTPDASLTITATFMALPNGNPCNQLTGGPAGSAIGAPCAPDFTELRRRDTAAQ